MKILIICVSGMSSSMLVERMREAAKGMPEPVEINALGGSEAEMDIMSNDVILLAPQIKYQKEIFEKRTEGKIPIGIIKPQAYGTMNGKAVLDQAEEMVSKAGDKI